MHNYTDTIQTNTNTIYRYTYTQIQHTGAAIIWIEASALSSENCIVCTHMQIQYTNTHYTTTTQRPSRYMNIGLCTEPYIVCTVRHIIVLCTMNINVTSLMKQLLKISRRSTVQNVNFIFPLIQLYARGEHIWESIMCFAWFIQHCSALTYTVNQRKFYS